MEHKSILHVAFVIVLFLVCIFLAVQYSSYKAQIMILKGSSKIDAANAVYIINENRKLDQILKGDKDEADKRIAQIIDDSSDDHLMLILRKDYTRSIQELDHD
jgi:hypothetical protein